MATSEIRPVEEKREEKSSFESPNQQETRMENSPTSDVHKSSEKCPTMKELVDPKKWPAMNELVDPKGPFMRKWKVIFLVSCVFAVLQDPLFLYIPIIINEQDIKCLRSDNKVKIAALVFRSVTDLCYLLNIFFQVYRISTTNSSALPRRNRLFPMVAKAKAKAKTLWRSYKCILIDILAVLPIPQIIILIFYFNTRGDSRSFGTRKLMNFFVLVQYVPRVLRIYRSRKEFMESFGEVISIWPKAVLNFFLFILASHVIGAFWYFFAIQQIATCWQNACRPKNGCDPSNLYCHDHHALRNIKIIDDLCSVDPPNEKLFKIGLFHDIIQLGILGSTDFSEKFSNCFWWGLRNLSSFGSNLNSSINVWENIFGAFISIVGLLLFLYLIGNIQTYMQLDTERSETQRLERRIAKEMEKKGPDVDRWLSKNGIPSSKKSEIMDYVKVKLQANGDFDVKNINVPGLPSELKSSMESCMPLNRLKKVQLLQNMDEEVLRAISEYLKPEKYSKHTIIIEENKPLQKMIFIVEGFVIIEMNDCSGTLKLSAGEVYGEKLLTWPAWTYFPSELPVATESVRADGDVEALVLMANDMKDDTGPWSSLRSFILSKGITCLTDDEWELLESDRVTMLRKVPKLKTMNRRVLKDISKNLKRMKCERYTDIITEGKPLRKMVFVTEGSLYLKKGDGTNGQLHKGEFYGEELLDWVLDRSFPAIVPISIHGVSVHFNIDILVLTAKDLGNFKSHFSKHITSPTDSSLDLCATVGLTWLKKGPSIFKSMEGEMLKKISKRLELQNYGVDKYIVRKNDPLEYMFIFVEGSNMSIESTLGTYKLDIGGFYGQELVHWVTYWSLHTTFPDKFPLSTSTVKVSLDETGNAGVLVLRVNELKRLASEFRLQFIKPFNLPVDSEGKLLAFDRMTTLKKVQELEGMDDSKLEEIDHSLVLKAYEDTHIIQNIRSGIDKMFLIVSGVVSVRSNPGGENEINEYHYSGDYYGGELLDWALRPPSLLPHSRSLPKSNVCVEAVGEVEALVLQAVDLKRLFPMPSDKIISVDQQVGSSSKTKGIDDNVVDSSKVEGQKITEPSPINVLPSPPRSRHVGSSWSSEHKKIDDDGDSSKGKGQIVAGGRPRTLRSHLKESKLVKGTFDKLNSVRGMYKKYKEEKRNR